MNSVRANWLIFFRILKCLSFSRVWNFIVLYFTFYISLIRKRAIIYGIPWSISVEPTNSCNLSCPECPTGLKKITRQKGQIDPVLFEKIITETRKKTFYLNLYFQGEPFLHKNISELISIAKKHKIFVSCSTNAQNITADTAQKIISAGLDQIIISYDGTTQESYEKYRIGGNLELVEQSIRLLVDTKRKLQNTYPVIIMQFLLFDHNIQQIKEAKNNAKLLGADKIEFKTVQLYNLEAKNNILPSKDLYTRYIKHIDGSYTLRKGHKSHCWKSWSSCVFTWDGNIVPCCYDKNAEHCFGNIKNKSLDQILNGEESTEFRNMILKNRQLIHICNNCIEK